MLLSSSGSRSVAEFLDLRPDLPDFRLGLVTSCVLFPAVPYAQAISMVEASTNNFLIPIRVNEDTF